MILINENYFDLLMYFPVRPQYNQKLDNRKRTALVIKAIVCGLASTVNSDPK